MKGKRTFGFALLTALIGVLAMPEVQGIIPQQYLPYVLVVVAVGNALLRSITTTPIFRRE